jgi:hypothetical protein
VDDARVCGVAARSASLTRAAGLVCHRRHGFRDAHDTAAGARGWRVTDVADTGTLMTTAAGARGWRVTDVTDTGTLTSVVVHAYADLNLRRLHDATTEGRTTSSRSSPRSATRSMTDVNRLPRAMGDTRGRVDAGRLRLGGLAPV